MTKPRQTKSRSRKAAPSNLNRVPVTNKDPLQQCGEWLVACTQTKAFQAFIPCDMSYVQLQPNFHSKAQSGTYKPLEAKEGELLRCRGIIKVPSRAIDAVSAAGVDVRLIRRLMEACVDMTGKALGQSDKRKHKAAYLAPNPELERQAKESVKSGADPLAVVKLKKANTDRLDSIAIKVLSQVGNANPYGNPYDELPDPATQTISCRIECTNCEDESEYSLRRIPLTEQDVQDCASKLPFCGCCSTPDDMQRLTFKGGTEALAKRAIEKFNKLAAEMAGIDPEMPEVGDTPKEVERKVEKISQAQINQRMRELLNG